MYNFLSVPNAKCLTPAKETQAVLALATPAIFLPVTTLLHPPTFSGRPDLKRTFFASIQRPSAP